MAWETRKGSSGRYYTRSTWVRGRVRREYVPLAVAALVAEMDAWERDDREAEAQARSIERQEREDAARRLFAPLDALDAVCRVAVAEAMTTAGYYEHKREWRRRGNAQHGDSQAA